MDERVRKFIENKEKATFAKKEEEKNELLISLGLVEKEYVSDKEGNAAFSKYKEEWDENLKKYRYYKEAPITVTDDEFEKIKKYSENKNKDVGNTVAFILQCIAWLTIVGGALAGFILAANGGIGILLVCWAGAIVSSTLFFGFAEIIKLLDDINNKMQK